MADSFLEGQLRRIRALSERMSQLQAYSEESRAQRAQCESENPLYGARDYRMISSLRDEPERAEVRRDTATDSRRRRRRR